MRTVLGALLLTLLLAPTASAVSDEGRTKCENHGVITQVTVLGENRYCVGSSCGNTGIILLVGRTRSCHGDGLAVVCAGPKACTVVGSTNAEAASAEAPSWRPGTVNAPLSIPSGWQL